jgi:hypothetical protein
MKRSSRLRQTANLSEAVHLRLNKYALAASAAGVGMLALSPPAEGKIVYTATHKVLTGRGSIGLDLNRDALKDFTLTQTFTHTSSGYQHSTLNVYPFKNTKNLIAGKGSHAAALHAGALIGPARKFPAKDNLMAKLMNPDSSYQWYGSWANDGKGVKNRYLGLKFKIKGEIHFGWARLTVDTTGNRITTTLTGYAYETLSKKPIIAGKRKSFADESSIEQPNPAAIAAPVPEPTTLGLLAMGSPALSMWRRRGLAGDR